MAAQTKCWKCGTKFAGKGDYCLQCLPTVMPEAPALKKASPPARRKAADTPVCPYCRTEVTWDNMGTSETELTIYVREKMYFCSHCRALLGFSSWHTEG